MLSSYLKAQLDIVDIEFSPNISFLILFALKSYLNNNLIFMGLINVHVSTDIWTISWLSAFIYTDSSMVDNAAIYKQFSESSFGRRY